MKLTLRPGKKPRSTSPHNRSHSPPQESALPTRSKPDSKKPAPHMSFNVSARNSRSPHSERRNDKVDDAEDDAMDAGEVSDDEEPEVDDDMAAMQAMMGFGGFGTTKNKKVAGNNVGAVKKDKKLEYRQYMNRQGGFNRPLSPSR